MSESYNKESFAKVFEVLDRLNAGFEWCEGDRECKDGEWWIGAGGR